MGFQLNLLPETTGENQFLGKYRLDMKYLGELKLTSGKVCACDPFFYAGEWEPYAHELSPGKYNVSVNCIYYTIHDRKIYDVAHAILHIKNKQPVRWENATGIGQSLSQLKEDEIYGYGVDSATGCFMDVEASKLLKLEMEQVEASGVFFDFQNGQEVGGIHPLPEETGLNVAFFPSGMGDGFYGSYWGFDANGDVCCLVTDFYMLHES